MTSLVVPAISETIATCLLDKLFSKLDLPAFVGPTIAILKPSRIISPIFWSFKILFISLNTSVDSVYRNPINQNKNDTFLKRYKSTSWHDKNLSKRFKSSSAAPPSSTPSSAAFSEAMAQHEEEENEDLFDYDSDDIYNIYNDYTNTTDDIDTDNNNTQQDNHYFQQDTKESLDHLIIIIIRTIQSVKKRKKERKLHVILLKN